MNELEKLTELFTQFPGIGPRQARRFVFFLLRQNAGYRSTLVHAISDVAEHAQQCTHCLRYARLHAQKPLCNLCADSSRTEEELMLVEKDTDIDQMEKSGAYSGKYFVLGGTLSLTGKKGFIREQELVKRLEGASELSEIILALSATTDGEYTSDYLTTKLSEGKDIKISTLGRGLSTGSELEYADATTLKQALKNRV
ncbi:recombination protein RecR [Candidatus Kaiserbacteria bacterium]|nr:MAG: recombination protein RecR [Candidatus Kaiserbacteria bacterium]